MQTALITGANRGIGLELCHQLKKKGFQITAVCRQGSDALKLLDVEIIEGIDVSQDQSIAKLKNALGDSRTFDLVINNAGLLDQNTVDHFDFESILRQFQINAVGPLRIVEVIKDMMPQGSKLVMITSRMGSIADNTSGSRYGYRMSKAALNIASVSLAQDFKDKQIAVGIIHPGFVKTDMTGHTGHLEPSESASNILARIEEFTLETSGTFWHSNGDKLPW
ncbi:Short-chain dehydrogenase/reductase (SDR) superfamily [hydrothermal vent metagenome]|uniref:Short-chain dehydrogenase/reductase (SDR) superfamily n=1 Tax=hydrothermal vent metagenome TaxID=652676 RepID=A0A3B1DM66_9ZZZZ